MKFQLATTCLAACALALPLEVLEKKDLPSVPSIPGYPAGGGSSKKNRVVGWDYTNESSGASALISTAATIGGLIGSGPVTAIMNWESWKPKALPSAPFQPMVQQPDRLTGQWMGYLTDRLNEGCKIVHFYNEPDQKGIAAGDACSSWKSAMLPLKQKHGLTLVSPSPTSDDAGTQWIHDFMGGLAANEKPDLMGTHFYTSEGAEINGQIQAAKDYLSKRHSDFGIKLAITEMGCTSRNPADVQKFNSEMQKWCDDQDFIAQYSIFGFSTQPVDGFVSPAAQMLSTSGSLTALGKLFLGIGN